jgi:hypothetical protein
MRNSIQTSEGDSLKLEGRILGWGNENRVHRLLRRNGEAPARPKVVKTANNSFFGWQTPDFEKILWYLELLHKHGIRTRKSVELIKNPVIQREQVRTARDLRDNVADVLTVGFALKTASIEWWRDSDFAIVEDFCEDSPLTVAALDDPELGPQLCQLLNACYEIYREHGVMVDPLGGSTISASLRTLANPTKETILSNLFAEVDEDGSKHVVLGDFGLMNIRDSERVYEIPGTGWMMAAALASLGHLSFEAMHLTLQKYDHETAPYPVSFGSIAPAPFAWAGINTIVAARRFWYEGQMNFASWAYGLGQSVSYLG